MTGNDTEVILTCRFAKLWQPPVIVCDEMVNPPFPAWEACKSFLYKEGNIPSLPPPLPPSHFTSSPLVSSLLCFISLSSPFGPSHSLPALLPSLLFSSSSSSLFSSLSFTHQPPWFSALPHLFSSFPHFCALLLFTSTPSYCFCFPSSPVLILFFLYFLLFSSQIW